MNAELHARGIEEICEKRDMYATGSLNTVAWFNNLSLKFAPPLASFANIRCLHLEDNSLESMDGFPELPHLHSIYLRV